jgi:hypothetical protein
LSSCFLYRSDQHHVPVRQGILTEVNVICGGCLAAPVRTVIRGMTRRSNPLSDTVTVLYVGGARSFRDPSGSSSSKDVNRGTHRRWREDSQESPTLAKIYRDMLICPENLIKGKTSRPAAARSSLTVLKNCRDSVPRTRNEHRRLLICSLTRRRAIDGTLVDHLLWMELQSMAHRC